MKNQFEIGRKNWIKGKKLRMLMRIGIVIGFMLLFVLAFKLPIMQGMRDSGLLQKILGEGDLEPEVIPISETSYLPEVTGPYKVGRNKIKLIDYSRYDFYQKNINKSNCYELMVKIYYPTYDEVEVSPYF